MSETVLLARPYPFLVEEMKPFLENDGYVVEKADPEGRCLDRGNYAGAVIALAALSEVKLEPREVLVRLRRARPRMPVIFAGLLPLESYENTLVGVADFADIDARLLGVDEHCLQAPELGKPEGFLYLQINNLTDPQEQGQALTMVRRHFG